MKTPKPVSSSDADTIASEEEPDELYFDMSQGEVEFLEKQHRTYTKQYKALHSVKKMELLRVKHALEALRRTQVSISAVETEIWQLANVLEMSEISSYAGLK